MKRATFAALLLGCSLAPSIADARGMYCTRHRQECNQREADRKAAQAAADEAHAKWYAGLSPLDKAKEDGRVAGAEAAIESGNAAWAEEAKRRDQVEAELNAQITSARNWVPLYILIGAVCMALFCGFIALIVSDSRNLGKRQ